MPYMIKNGKFCLETLKDARYKTEELGYLEIYWFINKLNLILSNIKQVNARLTCKVRSIHWNYNIASIINLYD